MKKLKANQGNQSRKKDILSDILTTILVIILISAVIGAAIEVNEYLEEMEATHTEIIPLQSINVTTRTGGSSFYYFVYGMGRVGEQDCYAAYRVLEDGGKVLYKMQAENTTIYETLDIDAQAYAEEEKNGFGTVKTRRLYVPQGSIAQQYNLSLE